MKNDIATKPFDCVQWTRETRDRISKKIAGMPSGEARRWLNEEVEKDPFFSRIPKSPVVRPERGGGNVR